MYCWVKEITGVTNTLATLGGPWVEYDTCLITAVKVHLTPRELHTANRMLGEGLHWDKNVYGKPAKPYDWVTAHIASEENWGHMGKERYELLLVDLTMSCTKMVKVHVPNWDFYAANDLDALTGDQYDKLCNSHAAADQKKVTLYDGYALHLTAHNRGMKFINAYFNRWSQSRSLEWTLKLAAEKEGKVYCDFLKELDSERSAKNQAYRDKAAKKQKVVVKTSVVVGAKESVQALKQVKGALTKAQNDLKARQEQVAPLVTENQKLKDFIKSQNVKITGMTQRMAEMKAQALNTAGQLQSATSKLEMTEDAKREANPNYAMPGLADMKQQYEACMAFFNEASPMETGTLTEVQVFQTLMAPDLARWGAGSTCSGGRAASASPVPGGLLSPGAGPSGAGGGGFTPSAMQF
jgi:hypothetical protein